MVNDQELDAQQKKALGPSIELVEAGPGAGKTRTIIARMRERQAETLKPVALVSFTNTAANEAEQRCHKDQAAFPNFVGTLDAFLLRYLVWPHFISIRGRPPSYIASWSDLPSAISTIHLNGVKGQGFQLTSFRRKPTGKLSFPDLIPHQSRAYFASVKKEGRESDLLERGSTVINGLIRAGTYDSDSARHLALNILQDQDNVVARRLAARFVEVIIDEFQDCSDVEVAIVNELKRRGVHVVTVADPDQGIYEFRSASPESYRRFKEGLDKDAIIHLELNYRSTPAICSLIEAFRTVGTGQVLARSLETNPKIVVAAGSDTHKRTVLFGKLREYELSSKDAIVLAHRKKEALRVATDNSIPSKLDASEHKTFLILKNLLELSREDSAVNRRNAIEQTLRVLLQVLKWDRSESKLGIEDKLELAEIARTDVAAFMLALESASTHWISADSATESIRALAAKFFGDRDRSPRSFKQVFRALSDEQWKQWPEAERTHERVLQHSHVHAVKGKEHDAVLLSIEKPRNEEGVWDRIKTGQTHESIRVLYVGASRARKLVVLGCRKNEADSVQRFLADASVPFEMYLEGEK